MIFPFGGTQKAYAAEFTGFPVTEVQSNLFKFIGGNMVLHSDAHNIVADIKILATPAAQDSGSVVDKLDSYGDDLGAWDKILDRDRLENSISEGIFLLVGTSTADIVADFQGAPFSTVVGDLVYTVQPLQVSGGGANTSLTPKQGNAFVFSQGKTLATNIGVYLWRLDPGHRFFNQTTVTAAPIRISGPQILPGKDYYVQLALKEDTIAGVHSVALGPVQKITTLTDAAAAETNTDISNEVTQAYAETNQVVNATQGNKQIADHLKCFWVEKGAILPSLDVSGCFAELFNNLLVPVAVRINRLTGSLFDAFAAVSLGSTIYGQGVNGAGIASFVENGWSLVRDISNIFFIFILLYAAIGLVLSLHHFDTKKIVAQVIIIAIIINFSLFFCRIMVDTSNVLSRVFYNAMNISSKGNVAATKAGPVEQPISAAIIEGVQPQKLLSPESLGKADMGTGSILTILLISFILNLIMAWIFFMCAAFFAGRIGVIWFSMIFAPLAFVTSIVPGLEKNLKQLGWHQWLSGFMKACFNAPIFFFFLYLIVNLVGGGDKGLMGTTIAAVTNANSGNWVTFLVAILLPTMIVVGLLMAAKKIAEDMAGEFGAAFAGIVAAGAGLGAMAITGGAAALGARTIGGMANRVANDDKLKGIASGQIPSTKWEKFKAQGQLLAADKLKRSSFDVRQTSLGNGLSKATGVNMNMGAGALKSVTGADFSTGARAGGYDAHVEREKVEMERKAKIFGSGYDKKQYDEEKKKIEAKETDISNQEDKISRKQEEIEKLKAQERALPKNKTKEKAKINADVAAKQSEVNTDKQKLREMKKGSGEKVITGKDAKGNPTTRALTKEDEGKSLEVLKADGTSSVRKVTLEEVESSRGLDKMQKNLENIKVARMKEYHHNLMKGTGLGITGMKRDELGNIKDLGEMDHDHSSNDRWSRAYRNMGNDIKTGLKAGLAAGLAGAVVGGPATIGIGVLAGGLAAVASQVRHLPQALNLGDVQHDAVHHAISTEKHDHAHPKDTYKGPSAGFFDAFTKVGSGGGGGGGHDDHGGGHDDHGAHH